MKKIITGILLLFFSTGIIFSRDKPVGTITQINNIASDGNLDYSNPSVSQEILKLTNKVKEAKHQGNTDLIKFYQDKVDVLSGSTKITTASVEPNIFARGSDENQNDNYSYTVLNSSHSVISGAVATDRITGYIYAAYTRAIEGASDEMYIYKSSNNGIGWTLLSVFALPSLGDVNYRTNEIDLEVVNRGDTAYVWCTAGLTFGATVTSCVYRCRQDGNIDNLKILANPSPNVRLRFPRITSDNARYTLGSYVYIMYTMDSVTGSTKSVLSKLVVVENPFGFFPEYTEKRNSSGAYFYLSHSEADSCFMQNDICYVNTPGDTDIVTTATVIRGAGGFTGTNLYMTTSATYGSGISGNYLIAGSNLLESPRIASPGYNTRNVMMTARRLYGGGDWDAYYYYSNNLNRNSGNFLTSGYVNVNTDTALTVNLTARYRSFDNFLVAFANKTPGAGTGRAYIGARQFKAGAFDTPYFIVGIGGAGTGLYGAPVPTFRNVNNDSCLIGWGNANGIGYNITGGSGGSITGTGNNSVIVNNFSLKQNYPNPFNPSTQISFTIYQNSFVNLTIFDITGKEITKLVNGNLNSGIHSIEFNAAALPSGVYYYKLAADGFSDVKKMMLVK